MNPLVIIKSARKHVDRRQAIRDTWLPDLKFDRMFVVGNQPNIGPLTTEPHLIQFHASDVFKNIAPKLSMALAWGLKAKGPSIEDRYDAFFVCDDDTYVRPERLEAGYLGVDYQGYYRADGGHGYPLPYIQGSGYWLSRKAAEIVTASEEMHEAVPDDVAVGRALHGKVEWANDGRYWPGPVVLSVHIPARNNYYISVHKALPDVMRIIHQDWLEHPTR